MRNPNKRLLTLMKKHDLDSSQVAELVGVKKVTVEHWRQNPEGIGFRRMPKTALELLEIKLNYDFEGEK